MTIFGIFNELMFTQNVNVARFARNVEWDFFYDFQTPCGNPYKKDQKNETFFFSHLHAFFTSKAPELMNDFMIEAQRLQQSTQHNTQPSIDTTDHPEQRFVNNSFSLSLFCFF